MWLSASEIWLVEWPKHAFEAVRHRNFEEHEPVSQINGAATDLTRGRPCIDGRRPSAVEVFPAIAILTTIAIVCQIGAPWAGNGVASDANCPGHEHKCGTFVATGIW